jgi:phage gp29-like protein
MNFWKRQIPDPIRGLTLERLGTQIDAFQNGYLAEFALTAEAMESRDDIIKNVSTKRKKAVTRHGWEILTEDCSDEARAQRDALEYFYKNLTCSHALRTNERGGFQLLAYQMMDAIGKGYSVHEIVWKPLVLRSAHAPPNSAECSADLQSASSNDRPTVLQSHNSNLEPRTLNFSKIRPSQFDLRHSFLTAHFNFIPLWYFEATSGRLRFLPAPGALHAEEMAERQWLVTVGDALMVACARAFLFKHYPLQAWLDYSQKYGLPGVRGITSAARGTAQFTEMEETLKTFMSELAVVTNTAESIDLIDLKGCGQPPFADLVERMDRVMASLWRGADLSTLSRDRGYGATLQEQEARILEQDDARILSEHLNATVDRWVLKHLFGPRVQIRARLKILVTPQECTPHDLAINQFLLQHGAKLSLSETMERYGRVQARPGEQTLASASASTSGRRRRQESHSHHLELPFSHTNTENIRTYNDTSALCGADLQSAGSLSHLISPPSLINKDSLGVSVLSNSGSASST